MTKNLRLIKLGLAFVSLDYTVLAKDNQSFQN